LQNNAIFGQTLVRPSESINATLQVNDTSFVIIYILGNFLLVVRYTIILPTLGRIAYQDEDIFSDKLEIQTGKHLVLQPLLILVTIAMVDFASLSVINKAWAGDENDNVPLANGMPTEDLCVTCENRKNVIQGRGLIVGTDHEDFIQGSTHDISTKLCIISETIVPFSGVPAFS
jgi:hypothetical protein